MSKYVKNWDEFPNFQEWEFKCPCCGSVGNGIYKSLVKTLQDLRNETGRSIGISSGYRCPNFNKKIGGDPNSAHLQGGAADFYFEDSSLGDQNYRISIVNKLKGTPYYHWCYCNVNGNYPNMGAAIHLDTLLVDIPDKVEDKKENVEKVENNVENVVENEEPKKGNLKDDTAAKEENNTNTLEEDKNLVEHPQNEKESVIIWLLETLVKILTKILQKMK
jgi:hypothetical protein